MQLKTKNIIGITLISLIGAVFIFSAITKMMPIGDFEYILQSQLPFDSFMAKMVARFFIGLELAVGVLLVCNIIGKRKWVFWTSVLMLIAFSLHLVLLLMNQGNDVNCGCMGSLIPMKPLPSILKNIAMIFVLGIGIALRKGLIIRNSFTVLSLALVIASLIGVYVAFPFSQSNITLKYHLMDDPNQPEQPKVDLKKGKHVVCLMTLGCSHCRDAAKSIKEILDKDATLPFYFIFPYPKDTSAVEEQLFDFLNDTKTHNVPFHFVNFETFADYITTSGNTGTPVLLMMQDSLIIKEVPMSTLNATEIKQWINK